MIKKTGTTVCTNNDNLMIVIPIKNLIYAQKHNPCAYSLKILDEEKFIHEFVSRILNFDTDPDTGISRFYQMLDDITEEMVEDGEEFLKVKWSPDDKWE